MIYKLNLLIISFILASLFCTACKKDIDLSSGSYHYDENQHVENQKDKDKTEIGKVNYSSIGMVDENGDTLKSRVIDLDHFKKLTLKLSNSNKNVRAEKIYLLLNGKQYDLNKDDKNSKTVILDNADQNELSLDLDFSDLEDGKYYGIFIVEHQLKEKSKVIENQGYSRFVINKGNNTKGNIKNNKDALKANKAKNINFREEMNKRIDFAVFTEEQAHDKNYEIKNNNIIKKRENKKESVHYAYLYNNTKHETDYAICFVSGDDIITTDYNTNTKLVLQSGEETVYKIKVPTDKIKKGTPYYFILIRYPLINMDVDTMEDLIKEEKISSLSFSQKFMIE